MAFSDIHILCVDDDADSCEVIEHLLTSRENSYILTTVSSPIETLDLIEKHLFDLYILDYLLPEMSVLIYAAVFAAGIRKHRFYFFLRKPTRMTGAALCRQAQMNIC